MGHAGLEYVPFPPPYVVEAFRALSEAGADCVVGHHPHVPQGLELAAAAGSSPTAWGTSSSTSRPTSTTAGPASASRSTSRAGRLASYEIHPYRITEKGLRRLDGRRGSARSAKKLDRISEPFGTAEGVAEAWQAYLAYYGPEGFKKEVLGILEKMDSEPRKGAAMFRNRITTLQHAELWRDALTRFMAEKPAPVAAGLDPPRRRVVHEAARRRRPTDGSRRARSAGRPTRRSPR